MSRRPQLFKLALTSSNKILANFTSQLQQQQQLLILIKSVLPAKLAEHASYCVISNQKVLIYTDKATWASQLRFYQSAILEAIITRSKHVNIAQVQMRLLKSELIPEARLPNTPSLQTAQHIRQTLTGAKDDPLRQALSHLCQTLENLAR